MPDDTEMLDWLEREQCDLTCWRVTAGKDDNGWTVEGADGLNDKCPRGATVRDAIAWAMKLHARGDFKTRADELREEC